MSDILNPFKNIVELTIDCCNHCPNFDFTHNGDRDSDWFCNHGGAPDGGYIISHPEEEIPDKCPRLEKLEIETREPIIIIVNGYPRSGKDTFCDIADDQFYTVNYSTVDTVKDIARQMGWNGEKTPKNRDMLSALKDFYVDWFDGTFKEIQEIVYFSKNEGEEHFIFIHAREPEEIGRVKEWCKEISLKCYTVFIERDVETEHGNHADADVNKFSYDLYIDNNGSLELFREKVLDILDRMIDNEPLLKYM